MCTFLQQLLHAICVKCTISHNITDTRIQNSTKTKHVINCNETEALVNGMLTRASVSLQLIMCLVLVEFCILVSQLYCEILCTLRK